MTVRSTTRRLNPAVHRAFEPIGAPGAGSFAAGITVALSSADAMGELGGALVIVVR